VAEDDKIILLSQLSHMKHHKCTVPIWYSVFWDRVYQCLQSTV